MKFSAILGSLAIYGLQVHAIPTDPEPQAIQPMELDSPVSNTLEARDGYCCVVLKNRQNTIANFIPRGTELYPWYVFGDTKGCVVFIARHSNDCSGWSFSRSLCDGLAAPVTIGVGASSECRAN
ncbi:hypothetical protein E4U09_002603 [Claviceps aff. purpurea]|uniref:Uncharacterized protein n=1 Tax=Claviceps aff. purpurea TaxID=1967640 RepID=A0A9P7QHK1_9HYPO|nr:hypothetical protein E4U09_002603 [Claviceps aff. purpurea]